MLGRLLCYRYFLLLGLAFQILHNHRDPPVTRVTRIVLFAQRLIGKSAHLLHLVFAQAASLHDAPRGVGPIRRELPIGVGAAVTERLGVGVSLNENIVRQLAHFLGQADEYLLAVLAGMRIATLEEHSFVGLQQFHAQSVVGDANQHLVLHLA